MTGASSPRTTCALNGAGFANPVNFKALHSSLVVVSSLFDAAAVEDVAYPGDC